MKKGQIWSTDVIVGTVIMLLALIVVIVIVNKTVLEPQIQRNLIEDNEKIINAIGKNPHPNIPAFIPSDKLREERVKEFSELDYEIIKQELGLSSDFCMFIIDENENLQEIQGVKALGSDDAAFIVQDSAGNPIKMSCNGTIIS